MRPITSTSTVITCLSMAAFSPTVFAQAPDASAVTLEEVVVTAQKRAERLQEVPISITVLSGDKLDGSSDRGVADALNRVPSVFAPVTNNAGRVGGGNPSIAIRGVSAATVGGGTTAYYLDTTPFGRAQTAFVPDSNPYDLDRVEVLRGPQGTLYGASALNGVVRVLTRNPDLKNFEFKARGSIAGTERGSESYTGDAAVNIPLIDDKLAARIVVGYQDLGGWIDKPALGKEDVNDAQKTNVRVKIAARPIENFSVGLSGWFSRTDTGGYPFTTDGGRSVTTAFDEPAETDFDAYTLDLGFDGSAVAIKSATSYLEYTLNTDTGFGLPPFLFLNQGRGGSTVFTQEVLMNSVGEGPWRWTVGAIYRNAQDNQRLLSGTTAPGHVESKSTATYGEVTRAFADGRYELTGGLRWFRDVVRNWEDLVPGMANSGRSAENTFTKVTPRVVAAWHPGRDSTVYASYSKGFRSGFAQGFSVLQTAPTLFPASVHPDTLSNYEIGGKKGLLDGKLNLESAVYFIDWKDVQQDSPVFVPGQGNVPGQVNGKSLSGAGVDLSVLYAPIASLTLGFNASWNDLTFDEDVTLFSGRVVYPKGSRRVNSPETTIGASVDYSVALGGSGYRGRFSASANYIDEQVTGGFDNFVVPNTIMKTDAMTLVRTSFSVEAPKHWTGTLYVDNLTDEDGLQPDSFSPIYNTVIRPRTYGLQIEYRY